MRNSTLRTKVLLTLISILLLMTTATLLLVQYRVRVHVRDEISQGLRDSLTTFKSIQQQRESTLERSAALLAALPPLKAVMTSQDQATIQDASTTFWQLADAQLFVLADQTGKLAAAHYSTPDFNRSEAQESISHSLKNGETRDWWFVTGHLFEVFLQPIYFGSAEENRPIGILAVGYEVDKSVAGDLSRVTSSQVVFRHEMTMVVNTVAPTGQADLASQISRLAPASDTPQEIQLGPEKFLATSVRLSSQNSPAVTLTVLKSFDQATLFLESLNRWIVAVGIAAVFAGSALVFFISTTFTRPLGQLVAGVRALEEGNFAYPLKAEGSDEIATLTSTFDVMRTRIQETQRQLLEGERLATIGRMASTISHDLRHPLTAILAYAEFLSEGHLSDAQRTDFLQEIRIAVNHMTDEINSLLGFSKQREAIQLVHGKAEDFIERAIQAVKVLPDFEKVVITYTNEGECTGWFDSGKLERVMLNLLFNACEAVPSAFGKIDVRSRKVNGNIEIEVSDNGPGVPEPIRENLFQPFVSHGKEKGIGLGLTVVQKIMQDHGGEVRLERSGPNGSVFKLILPAAKGDTP